MMDGIFISYRRDDSAGYAGRLYDRLAAHFGPERVFMDVEGIEPGLDFVEAIESAVDSCQVLIVIIGDEWTHGTDAAGRRRLDDPNDFIRLETGTALKRKIRVVPVLVGGAVMPLVDDLPEELKALTRRQAIEISHKQWDASSSELVRTLEGILDRAAPQAEPDPITAAAQITAPEPASVPEVAALPVAPEQSSGRPKSGQRWIMVGALGAAAVTGIAGLGWWAGNGTQPAQIGASPSAPDRPASPPTGASVVVAEAASNPGAGVAPTAAPAPVPPPVAPPKPEPAPAPPVAVPAPAPAPAPAPQPVVPPTPAPRPAPVIGEFSAEAASARARLCYSVSHADSLTLSPRPGELVRADQDCVTVLLEVPTVFTLTARAGSKTVRKRLAVVPAPTPTPTEAPQIAVAPTPEPARATAPAAAPMPSSVANSAIPVKGERWTYRSSGKWPTSPKRRFEVVAQSVAGDVVTDALNVLEPTSGAELKRSRGSKPDFIAWDLIGQEFSPYFGAFVQLARQDTLSGLPAPSLDTVWTGWSSQAKVLGRESVSVPAGSFNAYKVEVWSSRARTGTRTEANIEPVRVHFLIWYVPEIKRYVRMQRRVTTAGNSESEKDIFELLAHQVR